MTSPAHTRSHSAASTTSSVEPCARLGGGPHQLGPERRAALGQVRAQGDVQRAGLVEPAVVGGQQQADLVAEEQAHPAVGGAERAGADPHHLAGGAQRVEVGRPVAAQAGRQDVGLEHRRRDRRALEDAEHLDQAVEARARPLDALPRGQEPGQGLGLDRLDLAAQRGQRAAPQLAQHVVVAPLALDAVGPELAPHDAAVGLEPLERRAHPGRRRRPAAPAAWSVRNGPWVRAKRATRSTSGSSTGSVKAVGRPRGSEHPSASRSRAASSAAATRSSPATTTRMARRSATSWSIHATTSAPSTDADVELGDGERPEVAQQVVHLVGVAGAAAVDQALQLELEVGQHRRRRAARAAPRRRAARAAGRGRAPARRPGARPAARRPRTCRRRSSRTAATARTATPAACRRRRSAPCGCAGRAAPPGAPAGRTRR